MTQKETSSIRLGQLDHLIEHYAQLALLDGWIDHARYQVMQMEKDHSGLFRGIGKAVAKRIEELKNER